MEITLATPALLFPTVSLLMLAYTNRFLALAARVRDLHAKYREHPEKVIMEQIQSLRDRLHLIRNMQACGVLSLLFCTLSMFLLYAGWEMAGVWLFGVGLVMLVISLLISLREVQISTHALDLHLEDMVNPGENPRRMS